MRNASAASCAGGSESTRAILPRTRRTHPAFRTQWVTACFAKPPVSGAGTTVSRRHGPPRQDHATWAVRSNIVVCASENQFLDALGKASALLIPYVRLTLLRPPPP